MGVERRGYNRSKTYAHIIDLPVEHGRIQPGKLAPGERKIWNQMVAAMPNGYFSPANAHLLKMLCSHIVTAEVVAEQLAAAREAGETDLGKIDLLAGIHARESKSIGDLSARLRLTPKSRYSQEQASHMQRLGSNPKTRPWEK